YLAKNLGLDSVGFGYLQTTFGVLQLVGGPIFGSPAADQQQHMDEVLLYASVSGLYLLHPKPGFPLMSRKGTKGNRKRKRLIRVWLPTDTDGSEGVFFLSSHRFCYRFADQFGNRAALTLSCASASAFFLLLSMSTSVPILFLSRLPSVFMHGLPGKVGWV
ncbi:UNVERIFIED_CONTAM: hypothetical protein H355_004462, partial [Colinus virginianus]